MKAKRLAALLLVVAMLFTFVSVIAACDKHECQHVCPTCGKCTDKDCTDPVCADKCQGHTPVAPHVCGHVCPTCGKCTDSTCTDPVCADKCQGHDVDPDKGKTQNNPLTPEEAISLMKKAGSGVVVGAADKQQYYVQGVVNAGSTVDTQYNEWSFTLGTGSEKVTCQATVDNSVSQKPTETNGALDGATVIIHGFLELFQGAYKIAYLPQSASPTGAKFTPVLVDIVIPVAEVASVSLDHTEDMVLLASATNKYMALKATVLPTNAPQDVTWSVSANEAGITVENGRISWTETEGEATITVTATGTSKSASVKVKVQNVDGATAENPISVDEAIALLTDDGVEVFAGYAADNKRGFYLTGKAENSVFHSQTVNSYWTFDLVGSNGTLSCTTTSNFSGVGGANGNLDDYIVVMWNVLLKKVSDDYTAYNAIPVSATPPAVTEITIDDTAEVQMPQLTEIHVLSIQPARAKLDGTEQWHSDQEGIATVEKQGDRVYVTGVSAGTAHITVTVGEVTSNQCTVTVTAAEANKIEFDWTSALAGKVCDSNLYSIRDPREMITELNKWTPGQQEITSFVTEGTMYDSVEVPGVAYIPAKRLVAGQITIQTLHEIKKVTIKVVPFADATTTQLSVNTISKTHEKNDSVYTGDPSSAIDIVFELTEATTTLNVEVTGVAGNSLAIVGITLEW